MKTVFLSLVLALAATLKVQQTDRIVTAVPF